MKVCAKDLTLSNCKLICETEKTEIWFTDP